MKSKRSNNKKKVIIFLILTFLLCLPLYIVISTGSQKFYLPSIFLIMWVPAISSIIVKLFYDKNVKGFGWKPGEAKYLILAYFLPLVSGFIVYGFVWVTGLGGLNLENLSGNIYIRIILTATVGILFSILTALGEEIGWRGFLIPELMKKFSYTRTSLIMSGIWAMYHYPGIIFSNYNSGVETWYCILFFTMQIIGLSFILTWLRIKANSLWPAVILHASHNLFIQRVFDTVTVDHGFTRYITTDFGVGLAICYIGLTFIVLHRMKKYPLKKLNDSKIVYNK